MFNRLRYTALVLTLLGSGCASGDHVDVTLRGHALAEQPLLGRPSEIAWVDGGLLVIDGFLDEKLLWLDPMTGAVVDAIGRGGEGPKEFRGPRVIATNATDARGMWVLDLRLRRATPVRLSSDSLAIGEPVRFDSDAAVYDIVDLSDGTFTALGLFADVRLRRFRRDGSPLEQGADAPVYPERPDSIPGNVWAHAWQAAMTPGQGGRIAVGSFYANRMEFYERDGTLDTVAIVGEAFTPRFAMHATEAGTVLGPIDETRFGYIDLATDGDLVYALYSGRFMGDGAQRAVRTDLVRVFDWEGNYIGHFHLAEELHAITIDPRRQRMYGIRAEPEPAVLWFDLPTRRALERIGAR